jgi:hypothetical protein
MQSLVELVEPIVLQKEHGQPFFDIVPHFAVSGWAHGAHCSDRKRLDRHFWYCSSLQSLVEHVEPILLQKEHGQPILILFLILQSLVEHVEPIVLTGKAWTAMFDIVPHVAVSGRVGNGISLRKNSAE